jgi:parallel beta-helix repeat protein
MPARKAPPKVAAFDLRKACANAKEGDEVVLPVGRTLLKESLVIKKAITLRGPGAAKARLVGAFSGTVLALKATGKTTIRGIAIERAPKSTGDLVVATQGTVVVDACELKGARKASKKAPGRGLLLDGNVTARVRSTSFLDCEDIGLCVAGTSTATVTRCTVSGNRQAGIAFQDDAVGETFENTVSRNHVGLRVSHQAKPHLHHNELSGNVHGVMVRDSAAPRVEHNLIDGHDRTSVTVCDHAKPVVVENAILRSGTCGIWVGDDAAGQYVGNTVSRSGKHGFYAEGRADVAIRDGCCELSKLHGICFWGASKGTVRRNDCRKNAHQGIMIGPDAVVLVESNRCTANKIAGIVATSAGGALRRNLCEGNQYGMLLDDNTQVVVDHNLCKDNGVDGIWVTGMAQPSLVGNTCEGNGNGIRYDDGKPGGVVRLNVCRANRRGLEVGGEANLTVEGSEFSENGEEGILVSDRATVELRANRVLRNRGSGVELHKASQGTVYANEISENGGSGVRAAARGPFTIQRNSCEGNQRPGIVVELDHRQRKPNVVVRSNTCRGNSRAFDKRRTKLAAHFGLDGSSPLVRLAAFWHTGDGGPYEVCNFSVTDRPDKSVARWLGKARTLADHFRGFGSGGDGAILAFWLPGPDDTSAIVRDEAPVVLLASEIAKTQIVADSLAEFLSLLAYGPGDLVRELENVDHRPGKAWAQTDPKDDDFYTVSRFLGDELAIEPAKDPEAVVRAARSAHPNFVAWLDAHTRARPPKGRLSAAKGDPRRS